MFTLFKETEGPWELVRGAIRTDLETIEIVLNQRWAATFGESNVLPTSSGGSGVPSFTKGSIVFAGTTSLAEDNANLFWDDTNNRLGIRTNTPTASLTVKGHPTNATEKGLSVDTAEFSQLKFSNTVNQASPSGISAYWGAKASLVTNVFQYGINRNPSTGIFDNTSYTETMFEMTVLSGTSGNMRFFVGDTNNVSAPERMRLNSTGLSIGTLTGATARLHTAAGSASANTAPLKLTSGPVMTAPEVGAVEFTTDDFFATITTGAARKGFVLDDGTRLTSGKIPVATTNGRLIDGPTNGTFATIAQVGARVAVHV